MQLKQLEQLLVHTVDEQLRLGHRGVVSGGAECDVAVVGEEVEVGAKVERRGREEYALDAHAAEGARRGRADDVGRVCTGVRGMSGGSGRPAFERRSGAQTENFLSTYE